MTATPGPALPPRSTSATSQVTVVASLLVAVAALYLGQGIFVPLVLAILVAFALAPVVHWLRLLRLPQPVAVILTVIGAMLLIGVIGYLVTTQMLKLASDLPAYQQTIGAKIRALQQSADTSSLFDRLASAVERLGDQVEATTGPRQEGDPLPVVVTNDPPSPIAGLQGMLGSLLGPLATGAIVVVFVIFLLLQREDLRDRFLKLVSQGDLRTSTRVMNESAARVSRYLLVQFSVNAVYGVVFGTGLALLGVPNAILWGLFASLFRYIPFVGTLIAVTFPLALAFAVDPGWGMLIGVAILYMAIELTTTNAIEPRLYGSSTGLSPLAVLVAAIFWATLWGPLGLILATPLTVCLVVLGRYVPALGFLEVLLGSEPVLRTEERFYQRLLAGNTEEAVELAEAQLKEVKPEDFYDRVALPALRLAEADVEVNRTDVGPRRTVVETMSGVIHEIDELAAPSTASGTTTPSTAPARILVIGGKTELDGAAAEIIASLFNSAGMPATVLPPLALRQDGIGQIDLGGISAVCLCYLGPNPKSYVRYAARRLRRREAGLRILACLFNPAAMAEELTAPDLNADALANSVRGATAQVTAWLGTSTTPEPTAAVHSPESARVIRQLKQLKAHAAGTQWLDDFLSQVAADFTVAMAQVTVFEHEEGGEVRDLTLDANGETPRGHASALADTIESTGEPLVIPNVAEHKLFSDNAFLLENGIQFYAGVPLLSVGGEMLGALSIVDAEPREFSGSDAAKLQQHAARLVSEFEHRGESA